MKHKPKFMKIKKKDMKGNYKVKLKKNSLPKERDAFDILVEMLVELKAIRKLTLEKIRETKKNRKANDLIMPDPANIKDPPISNLTNEVKRGFF